MNINLLSDVDIAETVRAVMKLFDGELNDATTRSAIVQLVRKNLVDSPDLIITCDGTNNTHNIIEDNELVVDIFVRRNRSNVSINIVHNVSGISYSFLVSESP